jgi:hypothetical protein
LVGYLAWTAAACTGTLVVHVEDIVRTAYPSWAGWRWQGRLGEWTAPPVPDCPVSARLRLAVLARCNEAHEIREDTIAWITDVCDVTDLTVKRWMSGERVPYWEHACGVSLALSVPAWSLWLPGAEFPVVEHLTVWPGQSRLSASRAG